MNERQVDLVEQSFARAARASAHVAATFYRELFAIEPALRPMFKSDMIAQGEKLMHMLGYLISGLRRPEAILPTLRALATSHVGYGVEPRHYTMVGTALMRTLKHELGAEFTPETRAAWAAAYQMVSDAMCEAAYGPALAPAV